MADFQLDTTATVGSNTSITVTVYEDTTGNGSANNSASQSIGNGTNTYTLSGFDGSSGNDVWIKANISNSDIGSTASLDSASVSVIIDPPSTPQNLTSTVSGDDITLDWDPVNWNGDEGHYNVFRATSSGTNRSDYTDIADVSAGTTSYTDSNLSDGERYYYRVDATNSGGTSSLSNETNSLTSLPAVSGLSADAVSGSQIDLSWTDNSDNEDGFRIYRGTSSGNLSQVDSVSANSTSYNDTGLSADTEYFYEVRSFTEHTETSSTEVSATTPVSESGSMTATASFSATESGTAPESGTATSTAGFSSTETSTVAESGSLTGSALFTLAESASTTEDPTQISTSSFVDAIESATVGEQGSAIVVIDGSASATESATASESGTAPSAAAFSAEESAQTAESGSFTASALMSLIDSASTQEGGSGTVVVASMDATDSGTTTESGAVLVVASPSATSSITASAHPTTYVTPEAESEAELTEVFPSQSSADLDFELVTDPVLGFASEWIEEDSQFDSPTAFSVVNDVKIEKGFDLRVQYDADGDGTADYTTEARRVSRQGQPITFQELGDDGHYRIIISGLRPNDFLREVALGPTRY